MKYVKTQTSSLFNDIKSIFHSHCDFCFFIFLQKKYYKTFVLIFHTIILLLQSLFTFTNNDGEYKYWCC